MVENRNAFINGEGRRLIVVEEPAKVKHNVHNPYTEAERKTAILLAKEIGVPRASKSLGMNENTIRIWAKHEGIDVNMRKTPRKPKMDAKSETKMKPENEIEFLRAENNYLRQLFARIVG